MKKTFRIFAAVIFFALSVNFTFGQGQLLMQENFITPTGDLTTIGWTTVTGIGVTTAPPYIVVNPNTALLHTGYIESGVGNAAYMDGGGQDAQRQITAVTAGTVYLTYLIKVDSATASGDYSVMVRNTSNHNRWRLWIKSVNSGANFEFGVSKGSDRTTVRYTNGSYVFGETYLVVAKYDFKTVATADAELSLWVNPPQSSFGQVEDPNPAVPAFTEATTSDFATMNRFALIMQADTTAPTIWIGGIRMATDWKTALPPAPLYYNFSGTGDITDPNNWGPNLNGTGTPPPNFAADNQLYLLRNEDPSVVKAVSVNSPWFITGLESKLIIGAGVNLTIGSSGFLNGKTDISAGGVLTLQSQDNLFWPVFGNNTGSVNFDNPSGFTLSSDFTIPSGSGYYNLVNGNINVSGYNLLLKGKLKCNLNNITGTGTFTLDSAATLNVSSPSGINAAGDSGEIRTGTRIFSRYGNYEYSGQVNQVTGNGIPDTVSNITVMMANTNLTTSLSKPIVVSGNLGMTLGKYRLGNYNLVFNNPDGHSELSYIITDSSGALVRPVVNAGVKTFPIGSAMEYRRTAMQFDSIPAGTRNIAMRYVIGDTANHGFPDSIRYRYQEGYWVITSDSSINPTYRLDITVPLGFADTSALRVIYRPLNTSAWDTVGTVGVYSNEVLSQAGVDKFGQFAIGAGSAAPPPPAGVRYKDEVFATYTLQSNIQFGQAPNKTLYMDLYTAFSDTVTNRPMVIFIHGGGFKGGDKVGNFSKLLCGGLAKRGYVVSSINYRTQSTIANDTEHFEAMLKALQDAKAAVRYFRSNGTLYGIDTSRIYATGSSAGSITALHLAYLDSAEVPSYVTWGNVGNSFEGTSGTPGYSSRISGVVANWGAIGDTSWIKKGDVPVYAVHGYDDSTVFFNNIPADGPFLYSSKYIYQTAQNKSIMSGLRIFYNTGHTLDDNSTKQDSALKNFSAWLYDVIQIPTGITGSAPMIPTSLTLDQNYPNPFNPTTKIRYGVPSTMKVTLDIYNSLGEKITTLVNQPQTAGYYEVNFNATRFASGVYYYRLVTNDVAITKKMLILK